MHDGLPLTVCTEHGVVFEGAVRAARMPTESGQIGLRARGEPMTTVVEPGLVVLRLDHGTMFLGTAGGLLELTRERATLYTPFAATGDDGTAVIAALDAVMASPDKELLARRRLGRLEQRIRHQYQSDTTLTDAGRSGDE